MIANNRFVLADRSIAAKNNNTQITRPAAIDEDSRSHSRSLGRVAIVADLAQFAFGALNALRHTSGPRITSLAEGYSRKHNVNLHAKGPSGWLVKADAENSIGT